MSEAKLQQLPLELEHNTIYERDDLIVTKSNRAAIDLVDRWPDWVAPVAVVAGPAGSGKTHLAQVWRAKTGALAVTPDKIDEFVQDRSEIQPVLIEDIGDGPFDEVGLFHLINVIRQHASQGPGPSLLMTSRHYPVNWQVKLPDLASRLKAATVVEIAEPDDTLLNGVIYKLFSDRQISVEPHVVSYLVSRIERSLVSAIEVVDRLDRIALVQKSRISRTTAAQLLNEMEAAGEIEVANSRSNK